MYRTYSVADCTLYVSAKPFCHFDRKFHVPNIIDRVKNPENINSVLVGLSNEFLDHVIRIVPVPYEVLAPEQHLSIGIFHFFLDISQALPGIFVQVADAAVKGSTSHISRKILDLSSCSTTSSISLVRIEVETDVHLGGWFRVPHDEPLNIESK